MRLAKLLLDLVLVVQGEIESRKAATAGAEGLDGVVGVAKLDLVAVHDDLVLVNGSVARLAGHATDHGLVPVVLMLGAVHKEDGRAAVLWESQGPFLGLHLEALRLHAHTSNVWRECLGLNNRGFLLEVVVFGKHARIRETDGDEVIFEATVAVQSFVAEVAVDVAAVDRLVDALEIVLRVLILGDGAKSKFADLAIIDLTASFIGDAKRVRR
ncbi:MAG: hypothetical protein GY938_13490 [Ketobacter sp.]|nr:hypothetical protein [Ketobacter sp.]